MLLKYIEINLYFNCCTLVNATNMWLKFKLFVIKHLLN